MEDKFRCTRKSVCVRKHGILFYLLDSHIWCACVLCFLYRFIGFMLTTEKLFHKLLQCSASKIACIYFCVFCIAFCNFAPNSILPPFFFIFVFGSIVLPIF